MMRIGDVTGGEEVSIGAVSWDFRSGEGVDCEIDFGEDVAAIRVEGSVVIVDTNAFTSCGDQSGGGCVVVLISAASEYDTYCEWIA